MTLRRAIVVGALGIAVAATLAAGAMASRGAFGGCGIPVRRDCLRVLFIGNSYTSVNDLPGTFAALARSGGLAVEVASVAPGGQTLGGHAADPDVARTIAGTRWTAVILQEQSQIPAALELRDTVMAPAVATLVAMIRADGAVPYLLETWAHRDGWPERGLDRTAMQAAIDATEETVGGSQAIVVVPAGQAWEQATTTLPAIELRQSDGSHPTPAGTYLTAAVVYRTLTGRSPVGLGETGGLSSADAAALRAVAERPVP